MAFLLNNNPLPLDTAFTTEDGTQYPNNWLRLATPEERAGLGITEVADPEPYDDRYYWGVGNPKLLDDRLEVKEDGTPLMVQVYDPATESMVDTDKQVVTKGLKSQVIAQIKQIAASLLSQTDWKVIRASETSGTVDADTLAYRAAVRAYSDEAETAINAAETVDELAAIQFTWPEIGNA